MSEPISDKEMEQYRRMFACEHSTLTTILTATVGQLRDIPEEGCHPSMAATLMAINSMKAAVVAAHACGSTDLVDFLRKMCDEVLDVIYTFHREKFEESPFKSSQDIPDVFKKAFDQE